MRLLTALIAVVVVGVAISMLVRRRGSSAHSAPLPTAAAEPAYVRSESEAERAFYKPYASFYDATPASITAIVDALERETGLPRRGTSYPTDDDSIRRAARRLQKCALDACGFKLNIEDADRTQLDRFADAHLIDPNLRPFFEDGKLRNLTGKDAEDYGHAVEKLRVPNEPLLLYALGAFYGEWLVRHEQAEWVLYPPLNPIQCFPDMCTAGHTVCLHPFSQVNKKLSDPAGDNLAFKSQVVAFDKRSLSPYPLVAAFADGQEAVRNFLPAKARAAMDAQKAGRSGEAMELFSQAIQEQPRNPVPRALALPLAFQLNRYDDARRWLDDLLRLRPDNPMFYHNRALLCPNTPSGLQESVALLRKAIDLDPNYARARISLASYLRDEGEIEEAKKQADWVKQHDPKLADEAQHFLQEMSGRQGPSK